MSNQVRIKMDELPLRVRNLSPDEISKVFGGGCGFGSTCVQDCDCCPGMVCQDRGERFGFIPYKSCFMS